MGKDVVKSNQVSSASGGASAPSGDAISAAAKKLSDASYPFLKGIDWNSDLYIKPLPGVTAQKALKAVDKTILIGAAMDVNALKAGAEAHHKAIGSIDGSGVTSASAYEAVNIAIGHMVASGQTFRVMDVCNAWAGILSPSVLPMMSEDALCVRLLHQPCYMSVFVLVRCILVDMLYILLHAMGLTINNEIICLISGLGELFLAQCLALCLTAPFVNALHWG